MDGGLLRGRAWRRACGSISERPAKEASRKLLGLIAKLKEHGPTLPFPYSSQVDGRVRELRTRFGKTRLRILYFGDANQEFILLNGVVKDTDKLEESDIEAAKKNMAEHTRKLVKRVKVRKSDPENKR